MSYPNCAVTARIVPFLNGYIMLRIQHSIYRLVLRTAYPTAWRWTV